MWRVLTIATRKLFVCKLAYNINRQVKDSVWVTDSGGSCREDTRLKVRTCLHPSPTYVIDLPSDLSKSISALCTPSPPFSLNRQDRQFVEPKLSSCSICSVAAQPGPPSSTVIQILHIYSTARGQSEYGQRSYDCRRAQQRAKLIDY